MKLNSKKNLSAYFNSFYILTSSGGRIAHKVLISLGVVVVSVALLGGYYFYSNQYGRVFFRGATYSRYGGAAPQKSFEERKKWAQRVVAYKSSFRKINPWIHKSELILSDVGAVRDVAPIGSPNYYQACFTDGCHASMNLEVMGEKGTGILYLPYVEIFCDDYGVVGSKDEGPCVVNSIGEKASWTFQNKTEIIRSDGQRRDV